MVSGTVLLQQTWQLWLNKMVLLVELLVSNLHISKFLVRLPIFWYSIPCYNHVIQTRTNILIMWCNFHSVNLKKMKIKCNSIFRYCQVPIFFFSDRFTLFQIISKCMACSVDLYGVVIITFDNMVLVINKSECRSEPSLFSRNLFNL